MSNRIKLTEEFLIEYTNLDKETVTQILDDYEKIPELELEIIDLLQVIKLHKQEYNYLKEALDKINSRCTNLENEDELEIATNIKNILKGKDE